MKKLIKKLYSAAIKHKNKKYMKLWLKVLKLSLKGKRTQVVR